MTGFEKLTALYKQDRENRIKENIFFIENGFCESWHEDNKITSDNGIRRFATDTRWDQYQAGKITREKVVELTIKRMMKQEEKTTAAGLYKLEQVYNAPDLISASVDIDWIRSTTWGYNPHCETWSNNCRTYGNASGCGYDKQSAAVAASFNQDFTMLKVLYSIKENNLQAGQNDISKTACTGHDNRNIIGYGAGYSVLPYYEGGVGVECFWSIIKKAGYKIESYHSKKSDHYRITKEV